MRKNNNVSICLCITGSSGTFLFNCISSSRRDESSRMYCDYERSSKFIRCLSPKKKLCSGHSLSEKCERMEGICAFCTAAEANSICLNIIVTCKKRVERNTHTLMAAARGEWNSAAYVHWKESERTNRSHRHFQTHHIKWADKQK